MPPVLALLSTVAFSVLFGPAGVLLAAPLTLTAMVAVEVLWVEQALGEAPPPKGALLPLEKTDPEMVGGDEHAFRSGGRSDGFKR
jgi:hypothetical protein